MIVGVRFDPQLHFFAPLETPAEKTAEELRLAIGDRDFKDAIEFIQRMDTKSVGEPDKYGQTALHWAAIVDSAEVCEALCKVMNDHTICYQTNEGKQTVLHFAAKNNSVKFVKQLIKSGGAALQKLADIVDAQGQTALHLAAGNGCIEMSGLLYNVMKSHPALLYKIHENGYTALHLAVHAKSTQITALLTEDRQAQFQLAPEQDKYGQTALHWAAGQGNLALSEILYEVMKLDSSLYTQTSASGYTALHLAVHAKSKEIVALLMKDSKVEEGSLAGVTDKYGQTALHWAAVSGCVEMCTTLYNRMTPDQVCIQMNDRKQTALHFAVQAKDKAMVEALMLDTEKGTKLITIQDYNNLTAVDWADGEIKTFLQEKCKEMDIEL